MSRLKRIGIGLGVVLALVALWLVLSTGRSEARDRKIALGLLELDRQWESNSNIPGLFESLTNLPFHDRGGVLVAKGCVSRRYALLGVKWEEFYFIRQPLTISGTPQWSLYHAWYWYPPGGGKKEVSTRRLLTLTAN